MTITEAGAKTPGSELNGDRVPRLQAGDRLTVEEFERRYAAMPDLKKAELINGVVYMPSPVLHEEHGSPHFDVIGWLAYYRAMTAGVDGGDNSTLRLQVGANRPQPDAFLRILPSFGGRSTTVDGYVVGGPELIAEISASSASYDLHDKLNIYQKNQVLEYVVWRVWDKAVDWFVLRSEHYESLPADPVGIYRSQVFPGLWLDGAAMLRRDLAQVLRTLQLGLASPEHASFVAQLQARVARA